MADDLDAELLALAGDASDEDTSPPAKQTAESPAPSQSPEPSSRKGTAKASRRGRKSRRGEDGEVYV